MARTPGRATLTYCVVGPLHSYTQEGLVDNNNNNNNMMNRILHQTDAACAWLVRNMTGRRQSNPGPKPTLKTLSHTRTQPPRIPCTLAHQSNSLKPPHPHSLPSAPYVKHTHIPQILDLWMSPERVVPLLVRWKRRLAWLL